MPPDDFNEKIELLVNDENRIVTYKILSQELKIHVNKAKQCLMDFLTVQKSKGLNLEVHYFLAGFVEKDGIRSIKIVVVPEDKLETAKKNYIEVTSFHVYSIYKGATGDECALYSADFTYTKDRDELNRYSAIKHPNIEIQPPFLNKIPIKNDLRLPVKNDAKSSVPKKVVSNATVNGNLPSDVPQSKVSENRISPEKTTTVEKQSSDSKKTSPEDKKAKCGTLMSMWQKKEEKQNGTKKENAKTETKGKEAAKPLPKNNIMSMFSKQAVKNAEKPPVLKSVTPKEDETPKSALPSVKQDSVKEVKTKETKKSSQKRKASHNTSKKSSKSTQDSDSDNEFQPKTKKKHKRICTFDDSDSESENEEEKEKAQRSLFLPEEPMDIIPPTPVTDDEEPIPPTPPVINVKGKAKIWKTVQKTYEDEEGFFVTKMEKELVSASEDEEEPIKNQPVKKEEVIKKTTSVNKKQASLMSFFKQK